MFERNRLLEEYNDWLAPRYEKATKGEFQWKAPSVVAQLLLPYVSAGLSVLDVGIGTGQSAAPLFDVGCEISGIDISQEMLNQARKRFPGFELHKADLEEGLPDAIKSRLFDVVTAVGVLEFIEHIARTVGLLTTAIRPGGLLGLTFEEYLPNHQLQSRRRSPTGAGLAAFPTYRRTLEEIRGVLQCHNARVLATRRFVAYLKSKEKQPVYYWAIAARVDKG